MNGWSLTSWRWGDTVGRSEGIEIGGGDIIVGDKAAQSGEAIR